MNTPCDEYLWDPSSAPDAEIAALEQKLAPQSARALNLASRPLPLVVARAVPVANRRWKTWHLASLAAIVLLSIGMTLYFYRLSWPDSSPWPATLMTEIGASQSTTLRVGEVLSTASNQTATLAAARIGTVTIAENSSVALVRTRGGKHRLQLNHGRLRAKVWAPPGHFGVAHRDAVAIDLGCEFEMESGAAGSGSLTVISGWVIYNVRNTEVLVPAGHAITFDDYNVGTPVRSGSDSKFVESVARLDALLEAGARHDNAEVTALADELAGLADDADYLTLLSLVTRHPDLMITPLSVRLEAVLGDPGDVDRINTWWSRVPKPPKQWWWNWRDAM